jgi:hypothetical protein
MPKFQGCRQPPDLTGRENVDVSGAKLGVSKRDNLCLGTLTTVGSFKYQRSLENLRSFDLDVKRYHTAIAPQVRAGVTKDNKSRQ